MSRLVLWVDDNPQNNQAPAAVLKAVQANVVQVKSTRQALVQLAARRFDAIVSDMGRWEGPMEGYALLEQVRQMGLLTPFFFFSAGGGRQEHVAMALQSGADGSTSSVNELLEQLHTALYGKSGNA
jgi:CheY-like chemotaxis protein